MKRTILRPLLCLALVLPAALCFAGDGDHDLEFQGDSGGVFHFRVGTEGDARALRVLGAPDGAAVMLVRAASGATHDVWRRVTTTGASPSCTIAPSVGSSLVASDATFDRLGRLVVVGVSQDPWQIVVARYLYPDCELDDSFDGNGVAGYLSSGSYYPLSPKIAERRSSGDLLVFHFLYVAATVQDGDRDMVMLRIWDDGVLDTDWGGGDGMVRVPFLGWSTWVESIAVDRHRKLVVAVTLEDRSEACENGWCEDFGVARLTADGALDDSFDGNGLKRVAFDYAPRGRDVLRGLALSPNGRIALVGEVEGSSGHHLGIAVLRENGAFDVGFDDNGIRLFDLPGTESTYGGDAVYQTDGRLVVAGSAREVLLNPYLYDSFAARFLASGALDSTFGSNGVELLPVDLYPSANDRALTIGLSAGQPLVGGYAVRPGLGEDAYVLRLANGLIFQDSFEAGSTIAW